eukprot:Platyproteum_vivax@DN15319_c0_g1_i1.p1
MPSPRLPMLLARWTLQLMMIKKLFWKCQKVLKQKLAFFKRLKEESAYNKILKRLLKVLSEQFSAEVIMNEAPVKVKEVKAHSGPQDAGTNNKRKNSNCTVQ